jgi:hypothetical protein
LSNYRNKIDSCRKKASGDNVFVFWWDKIDGKDQPLMRISHDGGQTLGKAIMLTAISPSSSSSSSSSS